MLMISVIVLVSCTFFEVRNQELVEIWKYMLFTSLGYVVGVPMGVTASEKLDLIRKLALGTRQLGF